MRRTKTLIALAFAATLVGCNKEDPAQLAADGKATGAACRHAGRAIEDCFALNPDALRGAVFDGWKEMNDYMRENKIAEVKPQQKTEGESGHGEEHADASHEEGGAAHGESSESASAETDAEKTKVAAAEHGRAQAEEGEAESATAAPHSEAAEEKH